MNINADTLIVAASAFVAFITFVVIAMPFLGRSEKKSRYQDMIARKRKDVFEIAMAQEKERIDTLKTDNKDAKSTIQAVFKVRKLVGDMTDELKGKLANAGYRSPFAPLIFLLMRIILPVIFVLLAFMVISNLEKEPKDGLVILIMMSVSIVGFILPGVMVKNQAIKRQEEINLSFPDALDMMLVCVQGGISLEQSINRIAEEVAEHSPMLAEEMGVLGAELSLLNDRRGAFQDFAKRVGSGAAKSFATAMIQAEQYGTGISTALRVMADESRDMRMAEAERKAAALPPKLTVPMILFFLPALFIVILGPAGIQATMAS